MKEYILKNTDCLLNGDAEKKFQLYCDFLLSENQKYNLTAITERGEVYEKHFVDSMLGAAFIKENASICDVGSGAGFPAVPLKLLRNDIKVTLVDSLNKRIEFTKKLAALIKVELECVHQRAEEFTAKNREKFDCAVARAVAPLPILLEYTAAVVKIGGYVLAYKTDESELASAANAARLLGLKHVKSAHFVLPSESRRCILVFEKTDSTPIKYPRGQNKPRLSPL